MLSRTAEDVGPYGYNIIITPELNQIMTLVLLGTSRAPSPTVMILFVHIGFVGLYNIVHRGEL